MSRLEEKILDALDTIGYSGPLLQKPHFPLAIEGGPKSIEYTKVINFLTNEIRTLQGIDEEVNAITCPEDSVAFIMEVTSFLKELNCPYKSLTHGHVSDRLQNVSDRLLLLDYLLTELMGARILADKRPEKKIELKLQETPEGKDMRLILQTLRFPKPPANISITTLFQKLGPTIPIVLNKAGADIVGQGIFNGFLSEKQWGILNGVQNDLNKEYRIRREMLLTRLDVTIQSFQWSDRTRGKDDLFEKVYHENRKLLKVDPDVDLSDLIAARTDIAIIEKTSNSSVRKNTRSQLNKVIIGQVPDRGGRTSEIAPPPPEMPSWQQRSSGPAGGGRGGGNFNRGGGNFNRGGGNNYSRGGGNNYSSGGGISSRGGYSSGGGNYQSNQARGDYNNSGYGNNRSYDSAGSYNAGNKYGGNESSGYGSRGGSYDNSRSQGNYGRGLDNSNSGSYGGGGRANDRGNNRDYDYDGGNRRNSGGSYSSQDFQQTKRAKTYDSFQANKSTYADQYVQEREHNQQYSSRGGNTGRSNYQRGRGGSGYR
nr:protein FAM98B isoform X1 [Leptinotarsa decemlineata]